MSFPGTSWQVTVIAQLLLLLRDNIVVLKLLHFVVHLKKNLKLDCLRSASNCITFTERSFAIGSCPWSVVSS